jgi:hypothetical protein
MNFNELEKDGLYYLYPGMPGVGWITIKIQEVLKDSFLYEVVFNKNLNKYQNPINYKDIQEGWIVHHVTYYNKDFVLYDEMFEDYRIKNIKDECRGKVDYIKKFLSNTGKKIVLGNPGWSGELFNNNYLEIGDEKDCQIILPYTFMNDFRMEDKSKRDAPQFWLYTFFENFMEYQRDKIEKIIFREEEVKLGI